MLLKVHILLFLYIGVSHGATNESYSEPVQKTCPLITSFDNVTLTCENTWKVDNKTGTLVGQGSECWPSNVSKTAFLKCQDGIWVPNKDRRRLKRGGLCRDVRLDADPGKICKVHNYVVRPITGYRYRLFGVPPGKCYPEGRTRIMASLTRLRVPWCRGTVTVKVHYCPPLPYPQFGRRWCSGVRENVYGSTCTFSCNNGYVLDGPQRITCGVFYSKSTWSANPPSCKMHYCPPLPYPQFGRRWCSGVRENVYGSTCTFSCNNGYVLDGPQRITCGVYYSKSTWSANPPSCKAHYCPPLPYFRFGSKYCSGSKENIYGSTCTFSCNNGYVLEGPQRITCGTYSKRTWSAHPPSCKAHYCPPLPYFRFGSKHCSGSKENIYGSTCTFSCNNGYVLEGPQRITCGTYSKRTWSAHPPSCKAYYCPPLPRFHCGSKRCTGVSENIYGSTCTFSCNNGFALNGPQSITCGTWYSKTAWSANAPSCKALYCPSLPHFHFGIKRCSGYSENIYGSTCTFSCNNGYVLDGPQSITCGTYYSKTAWSANAPSCKEKKRYPCRDS